MYAVSLASLDCPLDVPRPVVASPPESAISVSVRYKTFVETTTVEFTNHWTNALFCQDSIYVSDEETAWDIAEYLRGGTRLCIERSHY